MDIEQFESDLLRDDMSKSMVISSFKKLLNENEELKSDLHDSIKVYAELVAKRAIRVEDLQKAVWLAMDKKGCTGVYMQIACDAIYEHGFGELADTKKALENANAELKDLRKYKEHSEALEAIDRGESLEDWRNLLERAANFIKTQGIVAAQESLHPACSWLYEAETLLAAPSHRQQSAGDWLPVSAVLPPEGEPFQAFHEGWVDENFNVYGIRECHRYGDGTQYASAKWFDHQDCWIEDSEAPQLWRPYVKPDRRPSHESEEQ